MQPNGDLYNHKFNHTKNYQKELIIAAHETCAYRDMILSLQVLKFKSRPSCNRKNFLKNINLERLIIVSSFTMKIVLFDLKL